MWIESNRTGNNMDINDQAILDRIERLAYQAGLAMSARAVNVEKTEPLTKAETKVLASLRAMARENPANSGCLWTTLNYGDSLQWSDIHELLK